jgi:outer membrane protein assembly factor BamB
MSQPRRLCLLASVAALLSACSWFGGGDKKMSALTEYAATAKAAIVWKKNVGKQSPIGFAPLLHNGVVYAAGSNGQVLAADAASGKDLWRFAVKEELSAGVGAGKDSVYFGTRKGEVVSLNLAGKQNWRSTVSSDILVAPQAENGVVIVRTVDGRMVGLNESDGKRRWLQQRTNPPLVLRNLGSIVADKGVIFVGMPGGRLVASNAEDGGLLWETLVSQPRGATELERIADVASTPLLDGEKVCAVSYQGRLACFDAEKGNLDWYREVSSATGLANDQRAIFTADSNGFVSGYLKTAGTPIWKQEKLKGRKLSGPAVFGNYVIVGDVEGYVHLLGRETGELAARIATDKSPIVTAPVATEQGVLVQTEKGNLYAIAIQ